MTRLLWLGPFSAPQFLSKGWGPPQVLGEVFDTFNRLEAEAAKERQLRIARRGEHLRSMPGVCSGPIFTAGGRRSSALAMRRSRPNCPGAA